MLTGLGLMLNSCFHLSNVFMDNSLGLKVNMSDFDDILSSRGPSIRLYTLDFSNSVLTIDRDHLLSKLSPIVVDKDIIQLVSEFLYLPIHVEGNIPFHSNVNISTVGFLTDVLLNFAFTDLAVEFQRVFPSIELGTFTRFFFFSRNYI